MIVYIFMFVAFLLDLFISNIFFHTVNNLTLLCSLFSVVTIFFVFTLIKDIKSYYKFIIISSFIYGILFTNNIALSLILFSFVGYITYLLRNEKEDNIFILLVQLLLVLFLYDLLFYLILVIMQYLELNIVLVLNKFLSSIIFNLLYFFILCGVKFVVLKKGD